MHGVREAIDNGIIHLMATRIPLSITLDRDVVEQIRKTRGRSSVSERVNGLLRGALLAERYRKIQREAERFYATETAADREESEAIQRLAMKTLARD